MIQPRVIRLKDAPAYLGVNMNYFNKHIRPHLPEIRYSVQMVGFDRLDLDSYVNETKDVAASVPQQFGEVSWDADEHRASINGGQCTTSTRRSEKREFIRALSRATSRTRNSS